MKKTSSLVIAFLVGVAVALLIGKFAFKDQSASSAGNWWKLNKALEVIDRNYVDTLDYRKMNVEALNSVIKQLDPHTVYLEPKELKDLDENLSGGFEGVGIVFNVPNDTAVILSVVGGGPSEKAGIMMGDRILKVDTTNIAGVKCPQDSMVRLMRGPKDSKVVLTIGRDNTEITFDIIRDKIPEHSVAASFMANDTTGYMQIGKFSQTTHYEMFENAYKLRAQGMRKLIIDLRGNTGGYFDQACNMANEFLSDSSLIVYIDGAHRSRQDVHSNGKGSLQDVELFLLIDEFSASASEILAGAIQDNDRGTIVGRRSFGKGLVQEPIYFSDGSGLKITVARYYTPSGRCIQKPVDQYENDFYLRYERGELKDASRMPVDSSQVYYTVKGRKVYGGGGIIPDVFVPVKEFEGSKFYSDCSRKALQAKFATYFYDRHRDGLLSCNDYASLVKYMNSQNVEKLFLSYAASNGIVPQPSDWKKAKEYMMPQILGLCGRYSKVGEEAYYRYVLPIDDIVMEAMK